ncbi:MAG: hypothetical protein SR1Q7_09365 [Quinella sp. 1Q7]|nr:hypothetical protein [Quinella sp. 1Q7]
MANEILKDEILDDSQLDDVAGGNLLDRSIAMMWVQRYYGTDGTHGKIIDTSSGDANAIMSNFCAKAGIDYQMNVNGLDQFKINGQWRDAAWIALNKQEALDFFDKQLGITK